MKIGLLICDHVEDSLTPIQGGYDNMYSKMLAPFECKSYFVCDGVFPSSPMDCDAWLIGGSKFSVYDDLPWISRLKSFVQAIYDTRRPYVGLCFGHQMLAESLGGEVRKAPAGWCLGANTLHVSKEKKWMVPFSKRVNVLMLCQDQILNLPEESTILASTDDCPIAIFTVGDKMLGIQGHPEFTKEYERAIITSRRDRLGEDLTARALSSLDMDIHHNMLSNWIAEFLRINKT